MNDEINLAHRFYGAFQRKDYAEMARCYHEEALFSDPVFRHLNKKEVSKMWEMLLKRGKDLKVDFSIVHTNENVVKINWTASYTFSQTGRHVINQIDAQLELKDGLIFRHTDVFNLYKWSSQALGITGLLLGWTPFVKNGIRNKAMASLKKYMEKNPD